MRTPRQCLSTTKVCFPLRPYAQLDHRHSYGIPANLPSNWSPFLLASLQIVI
jgi:hypothetical protein